MATRTALLKAGKELRAVLFGMSQNGIYAAPEREGFARLMTYYHLQLDRFLRAPCCGESSVRYDPPLSGANAAVTKSGQCKPGQPASQQPLYDAVFAAGESLTAVTTTPQAVTTTVVIRAKVVAAKRTVRRPAAARAAVTRNAKKVRTASKKAPAAGKVASTAVRRKTAARRNAKRAPAKQTVAKRKAPPKRKR